MRKLFNVGQTGASLLMMMMMKVNVLTTLQGLGSGLFPNTGVKTRTKKRSFNWTYAETDRDRLDIKESFCLLTS